MSIDRAGETSAGPEMSREEDGNGTVPALEKIMRRYAAMVFRICFNVTRNSHDAEDATQAAFLALHVQLKTGDSIRNIGGWLSQVAQRLSLDLVRGKKRRHNRESIHHSIVPVPEENPDRGEAKAIIAQELDKLPAKYRLPLILHYFGGMSHQEMSREINCKPGTLRVRLCRAKEMLGERLSSRGIDLTATMLAFTLEQMIHGAVTESIVNATRNATQSMNGWPAHGIASRTGADLWRTGVVTAKTKALIGITLLAATTVVAAVAQALGSVSANLTRRIPREIDAAIHAMTQPVFQALMPSIEACATQPADVSRPVIAAVIPAVKDESNRAIVIQGSVNDQYMAAISQSICPVENENFQFTAAPGHVNSSGSVDITYGGGRDLPSIVLSMPKGFSIATPHAKLPLGLTSLALSTQGSLESVISQRVHAGEFDLTIPIKIGSSIFTSDVQTITPPTSVTDAVITSDDSGNSHSNVVPEPAGLAILAGGFLLLRRRRR